MSNESKKIKGVNITLKSENEISCMFNNLATPQKYDDKTFTFTKLDKDLEEEDKDYKYGTTLLIDKGSKTAQDLKDTIDTLWKEWGLDKNKKAEYPMKCGDEKAEELEARDKNGEAYRGKWVVKTGTKKKPKIFTTKGTWKGNTKTDDNNINGYFCNVILYPSYYKAGTNLGVTCYLNGIQLIKENPDLQFGSNPESEFDFEEKEPEVKEEIKESGFEFDKNEQDKEVKSSDNNIEISDEDLPF